MEIVAKTMRMDSECEPVYADDMALACKSAQKLGKLKHRLADIEPKVNDTEKGFVCQFMS